VVVPVALLIGCGGAARRAGTAGAVVAPGALVNPRACGPTGTGTGTELGRGTQAFLAATLALELEIAGTETELRHACDVMGRGLGLPRVRMTGSTRAVCGAVAQALHEMHTQLDAAMPAGPTAANRASNGASTSRSGTASMTVSGPPAPAAVGDTRVDAALRGVRTHLPGIVRLRMKAAGPLQTELHTWGRTAADLVAAGPEGLRPLGSRAACMFDQLVIAGARMAIMHASLTAQLEASAAIQAAARIPLG
jgi:hypothetical protein